LGEIQRRLDGKKKIELVGARVSLLGRAGIGLEAKRSPLAGSHGNYGAEALGLWRVHIFGWAFVEPSNLQWNLGL